MCIKCFDVHLTARHLNTNICYTWLFTATTSLRSVYLGKKIIYFWHLDWAVYFISRHAMQNRLVGWLVGCVLMQPLSSLNNINLILFHRKHSYVHLKGGTHTHSYARGRGKRGKGKHFTCSIIIWWTSWSGFEKVNMCREYIYKFHEDGRQFSWSYSSCGDVGEE